MEFCNNSNSYKLQIFEVKFKTESKEKELFRFDIHM